MMRLLSDADYRAALNVELQHGIPLNLRDALDKAGKGIAAAKARTIGVLPHEVILDPSQAGGLLGKVDGAFEDGSGIEIKAARSYRGDRSFQFSRIRPDSPFQHLFLIGRSANPRDWTNVHELDALCWLGYVSRARFDEAVARLRRSGHQAGETELRAAVTVGSRKSSWLGPSVKWVQFRQLDLAWWRTHVWPGRAG